MKTFKLKYWCAVIGMAWMMPLTGLGDVSAPFNLVYGNLYDSGRLVNPNDTNYVVEARQSATGPTVSRYQVGISKAAGNYSYYLDLPMEELTPKNNPSASLAGEALWLVLMNKSGILYQTNFTISERGAAVRMDLGSLDTDGNGLPDAWEIRNFGQKAQDPNADPDGDGLSNLQEYQEGLNPLVKDRRHPADLNPKDNWLTLSELIAYAKAYTNSQSWPVNPNPITPSYMAKAERLWKEGEYYSLDTNATTGAPAWWTNSTPTSMPDYSTNILSGSQGTIVRSIPTFYTPGVAFIVTNLATPSSSISIYALEDWVPTGWIATNISNNGSFDAVNSKVKWGPYYDSAARQLTYSIVPSADAMGHALFSGVGCLDSAMISITGNNNILSKINHPPVANDDLLFRSADLPLIISTAELLANDTDPDGDVLVVRSVDSTSNQGALILLEANQIKYLPSQNQNGADSFKYIVSDNRGGLAEATANVSLGLGSPPGAPVQMFTIQIKASNVKAMRMIFKGYPNWDYDIQAATNLETPDWITIGHGVTQWNGLLEFIDPEAAAFPIRFYRAYGQ